MNTKNTGYLNPEKQHKYRLAKRMLQGAGLATIILTLFFLTMGESNTENLRWMILPYIFVTAAGGLGGLMFHLMQPMRKKEGIFNALSIILSSMIFAFLLAVGFILGMNGPN